MTKKLLIGLLFLTGIWALQAQQQPHIIIIYVDDMGIGDASYTGGKVYPTPNIDRLAEDGKVFTQYYTSAPVCSPSRVSITTGMYPLRWNINTFLSSKKFNRNCEQSDYLSEKAPSMARILKSVGYQTAHFGKWHMGGGRNVKEAPSIAAYGFDEFASTWESPNPDPLLTSSNWIWAPTDSIKRWDRTAYFVDKTLDFLKRKKDEPCFINLWPDDVHSPWVASAEAQQEDRKEYYTLPNLKPVLRDFDIQIGRLLDGLKDLGIHENTLILFTSDNGPAPSFERQRTNGLRGIKNSLYEGGILMPFIAHWPGIIQAGQIDSSSIIASIDLLPTLSQLTGATLPANYQLDGEEINKSLLAKETFERKKELYWDYGRNEHFKFPKGEDRSLQLAIRLGKWKLFTTPDGAQVELYNLKDDPSESKNLATSQPDIAAKLKEKVQHWFIQNDKAFLQQKPQKK